MTAALVIGGGPAGAAAAIRLAEAGRAVTLLERTPGPHDKVCGEFLSGPTVAALRGLGLDPEALGAVPISSTVLCRGTQATPCPLPFPALSLSRRILDEALLRRASEAGVEVRRPARAVAVEGGRGDWRVTLDDDSALHAAEVFLATGKHDLRGRRRGGGLQGDLVGFKLHARLAAAEAAALRGIVEIHLFPGGYAGLEPVEGGSANLCLVVRRSAFAAHGRRWEVLLAAIEADCPLLKSRLAGARWTKAKPLAITGIPYGHVHHGGDGLWRLGDQAAVIPSFAGEGMAIALTSGCMAADYLLSGRAPETFQRALASRIAPQVRGAALLSQAVVRAPGQALAARLCAWKPDVLAWLATHTRVATAA